MIQATRARRASIIGIISLLYATASLQAEDASLTSWRVTLGVLNDNIPIPYSWAIEGWSLGPDDQYTFQCVAHARYGNWGLDLDDTSVTSRLYDYRFDVLRILASYDFSIGGCDIRPQAGIAIKGNCGGELLQNLWHRYVVIYPDVGIPYLDPAAALFLGMDFSFPIIGFPSIGLALDGFADLDAYTGAGATTLTTGLELSLRGRRVELELVAGADCHTLLPDDLEPLMGDGFSAACLFTFKPCTWINMSLGVGVYPVGDVTDDVAFKPKDYPVTAQTFYLVTFGERTPRLREFVLP